MTVALELCALYRRDFTIWRTVDPLDRVNTFE